MTAQLSKARTIVSTDRLVAVLVRPMPLEEGVSELEAVIDLLRYPAMLFGPPAQVGLDESRCFRTTWEDLPRPLEHIHGGGVSITYVRHLLHLAAYFMQRFSLRRAGPAVVALFEGDGGISLRFDMPLLVSREAAARWTDEFWAELNYVDLLQPNFLIQFTDELGHFPALGMEPTQARLEESGHADHHQ